MTIKHQLYKYCVQYVEKRIETAKEAMDAAQEAVISEDKVSVGDHHETGRAMMQLEKENTEKQLVEALKLKDALGTINPDKSSQVVTRGSLVAANNTNYYISISAGKIIIYECYSGFTVIFLPVPGAGGPIECDNRRP